MPSPADINLYIIREGDVSFNAPFAFKDAGAYVFAMKSKWDMQLEVCMKYLNWSFIRDDRVVIYIPISTFTLLMFDRIARGNSTTPVGEDKGFFFEEGETAFWMLTLAIEIDYTGDISLTPFWFIPYIFTDSPPAIAGGLTAGFPKHYATINMPQEFSFSPECLLEALVLNPFSPNTKTTKEEIVRVTLAQELFIGEEIQQFQTNTSRDYLLDSDLLKERARSIFSNLFNQEKFDNLGSVLDREELLGMLDREELRNVLDRDKLRNMLNEINIDLIPSKMVFLKQFRAATGNDACYKSIVEADIAFDGFHYKFPWFWLYSGKKFEITITDYDSCAIAANLGLQNTQNPILALWANFDFSFPHVQEVWRTIPPQCN